MRGILSHSFPITAVIKLANQMVVKEWRELDFLVHSIAFSPTEALGTRVVDVQRDGFVTTMEISCWSFIRMAHMATLYVGLSLYR